MVYKINLFFDLKLFLKKIKKYFQKSEKNHFLLKSKEKNQKSI